MGAQNRSGFTDKNADKRLIWITGASSGIGKCVAVELANFGHVVIASARNTAALEDLASSVAGTGKIIPLPCDVCDRAAMEQMVGEVVSQHGVPDTVLLSAGKFDKARYGPLSHGAFDACMNTNYSGVLNVLIPIVNVMIEKRGGTIAVISSVAGYGGLPGGAAYGASKAALINLVESMHFDLKPKGIRLKLINPGYVDTPMTENNRFPMPFLMPVEKAASRLIRELDNSRFESTFPRRFTFMLKALNMLPYSLYFPVVRKITGNNG